MYEKSHNDISGITAKAPCEAARIHEQHVRIEIRISLCVLFVRYVFFLTKS